METVEISISDLSPGDRLVRDERREGAYGTAARLLPYRYVRTERKVLRAWHSSARYWTVLLEGYGTLTIKHGVSVLVRADRPTIKRY